MATVIDFSAAFPDAVSIKESGHSGAAVYVSPARAGWMGAKPVTRGVVDSYRAAGLQIGAVWQYGGSDAPDVMRGAAGGRADAAAAEERLRAVGLDDWPVFFAVDFNISLSQWNQTAVAYFRAAVEVLGRERVGIYGHSRVVHWAQEDGVVADVGGGRCLGWVTSSWSDGVTGEGYAVLYQRVHNVAGPAGVQIDVNDVLAPGWGSAPAGSNPKEVSVVADNFAELDWSDRFDFGSPRPISSISRIVIHTTESPLGTPATNVAQYQLRERNGSYHYLIDRAGTRLVCNTDDWATWSVGNNAGNFAGLNLAFLCFSAQTRDQWISEETMLRAGAGVVARWARKYNIPVVKTDGTQRGLCGHGDLRRYGGTDHTDPGANFPWDVFTQYVADALAGAAPKLSEEDELMSAKDEIIAAVNRYTGDYIKGFIGPIGSDVKDVREQLTGGRDAGDYRGWPQLGQNAEGNNLAVVDGLAAARVDIANLSKQVADLTAAVAALTSERN